MTLFRDSKQEEALTASVDKLRMGVSYKADLERIKQGKVFNLPRAIASTNQPSIFIKKPQVIEQV